MIKQKYANNSGNIVCRTIAGPSIFYGKFSENTKDETEFIHFGN